MSFHHYRLPLHHGELDLSERTHIMGILNLTPDSFSGGGERLDTQMAVERALRMVEEGADIIDFGGESTRPGSVPVAAEEELRRVMPVIEAVLAKVRVATSIDTYKAAVANQALAAGVDIVNDISGLRFDAQMASTVAAHDAACVVMHTGGSPGRLHDEPITENLLPTVLDSLAASIRVAERAGIREDKIIVDPGIGFTKTWQGDIEIHKRLREFEKLGRPLLFAPSRKKFIGRLLDLPSEQRIEGTIASCAIAAMRGAHIVRVHDVKAVKRAMTVIDALK